MVGQSYCEFDIELLCSKMLFSVLTSLQKSVQDLVFDIDPGGSISSVNMDISHVWVVTFNLQRNAFGKFEASIPGTIALSLDELHQGLKSILNISPETVIIRSNGPDKIDILGLTSGRGGLKCTIRLRDESDLENGSKLVVEPEKCNGNISVRLPSHKLVELSSWQGKDADCEVVFSVNSEELKISSFGKLEFEETIPNPRSERSKALIEKACLDLHNRISSPNEDQRKKSLSRLGNGISKTNKSTGRTRGAQVKSEYPDDLDPDEIISKVQDSFGYNTYLFGKYSHTGDRRGSKVVGSLTQEDKVSIRLPTKPVLVVAKMASICPNVVITIGQDQPAYFSYCIPSFRAVEDFADYESGIEIPTTIDIYIAPKIDDDDQ